MNALSKLFRSLLNKAPPKPKAKEEKNIHDWLEKRRKNFNHSEKLIKSFMEKHELNKKNSRLIYVPAKTSGFYAHLIFMLIVEPDTFTQIIAQENIRFVEMVFPDSCVFEAEAPRIFQTAVDSNHFIRLLTISTFDFNSFFEKLWQYFLDLFKPINNESISHKTLRKYMLKIGMYFDVLSGRNLIKIPIKSMAD